MDIILKTKTITKQFSCLAIVLCSMFVFQFYAVSFKFLRYMYETTRFTRGWIHSESSEQLASNTLWGLSSGRYIKHFYLIRRTLSSFLIKRQFGLLLPVESVRLRYLNIDILSYKSDKIDRQWRMLVETLNGGSKSYFL